MEPLNIRHVARARQHRIFLAWARKSKNGMGWWYGFKLHVQCDEAGRLCGFELATATVDDHNLLDSLTRWLKDGNVVGDGGYLSGTRARAPAPLSVYLLTTTRKNMRHVASQLQLACLPLCHRVEELFAFMKGAFGAVRERRLQAAQIACSGDPLPGGERIRHFPSKSRRRT